MRNKAVARLFFTHAYACVLDRDMQFLSLRVGGNKNSTFDHYALMRTLFLIERKDKI